MRAPPPSLLPRPSCHAALTAHLPPNPPPLRRRTRGTPLPELPAVGQGKSTSSQIGSFWHDKHMYGPDLNNQQLRQRSASPEPHREPEPQIPTPPPTRTRNGIMRLIPIELRSQFALEDLPTADRML